MVSDVFRVALRQDASDLCDIRRRSILELSPPVIPRAEAERWASQLALSGMEQKLRDMEIWIAERDHRVAGWGAIRGDYLEGLYVAPEYAGRGVGSALLGRLEALMRGQGIRAVRAEASSNAKAFYFRRGYTAAGPQKPVHAWPIIKQLLT